MEVFNYYDPLVSRAAQYVPSEMIVDGAPPRPAVTLFRLLLGTLNLDSAYIDGVTVKDRVDYFTIGTKRNTKVDSSVLKRWCPNEDLVSVSSSLVGLSARNFNFFKDVLAEVSYAIYLQKNKKNVSSFVHCYRAIERISYAFPMIYAYRSKDLKSSYSDLKDFFSKGNELGLINKMMVAACENGDIADIEVDIIFEATQDERDIYVDVYSEILGDKVVSTTPGTSVSIKFSEIGSSAISIRNRYFHALSGDPRNIDPKKIGNPEAFIAPVISHTLNWLAAVFELLVRQS